GKINFRSSGPCTFLPRDWSYAVCSRHLCHPSQTGFELCSFLLRDRIPEGKFFFLGERILRALFSAGLRAFHRVHQLVNQGSRVHRGLRSTFHLSGTAPEEGRELCFALCCERGDTVPESLSRPIRQRLWPGPWLVFQGRT